MLEWQETFYGLYPVSKNKLYKIVGPFILGIELIKIPGIKAYKPYFDIYPLYDTAVKNCLNRSLFLIEFRNDRDRPFEIRYDDKFGQMQLAQESVKNTLTFNLNEPFVAYGSFIELIDYYLYKYDHGMFKSHSGNRANMLEIKFYASLYAFKNPETILKEIAGDQKSWDMVTFNNWHGDYETWLNNLQENLNQPALFFNVINKNKIDKSINKIPVAELL